MPRVLVSFFLLLALPASAAEYRAFWVETFNTPLGTTSEIGRVIDAAVASNANALFVQVRRRGDSWYFDSKEPRTEVPGVGDVDPLRYLVEQAHARNIQVHAFVIVGSIYNADPAVARPRDANHVFNTHFWDPSAGALLPANDPRQWATRSLPHRAEGTSYDGQRHGTEWYIDPGHPDAAAYTVEVLAHLVSRYDVDGLHLDRIRYPEAPIDRLSGQPIGVNVGYNARSVARFIARHGDAAAYYTGAEAGYPVSNDPLWNQWRRDQVTALVRRIWLEATAIKPAIAVSAAVVTFGSGPAASGGFEATDPYSFVFQDWRSWTREGILDLLAPMAYKREHVDSQRAQFDDWTSFARQLARANGRHVAIGIASYLNGIEGTLRQARRALARPPFDSNDEAADGVLFYALGNTAPGSAGSTNTAVSSNPYSYPTPNQNTPQRTAADFFSALRTGSTAGGARLEEPALTPLFVTPVETPPMPWKESPSTGHLMGIARLAGGVVADGGTVVAQNLATGSTRSATADGNGFYGFVGLEPGMWRLGGSLNGETITGGEVEIAAGLVARGDLAPGRQRKRLLRR